MRNEQKLKCNDSLNYAMLTNRKRNRSVIQVHSTHYMIAYSSKDSIKCRHIYNRKITQKQIDKRITGSF